MEWRRRRILGVRHLGEWQRRGIPGVGHPDEMAAQKDSGHETSGWKWRHRRIPGVRHPGGNGGAEGFRA